MGSGRSIHGFDLYRALCQCDHLFEKFGGHAHAAGITMKAENLEVLREQMEKLAFDTLGEEQLTQVIEIDAELDLEDITTDVIQDISALSPFGEANPEPLLLCRFVQVLDSRTIAGRHLKMKLGQGKRRLDAIGFGLCEQGLSRGERIDIVFTPEINCWGGYETIQLRIVDIQRSAGDSG
jgi:single-stranded-DNA-specific exonuclease